MRDSNFYSYIYTTEYVVHGRAKPVLGGGGITTQTLTCSIMEKPHTGLDDCPEILLLCFRARTSGEGDVDDDRKGEKRERESRAVFRTLFRSVGDLNDDDETDVTSNERSLCPLPGHLHI